ncbi:MAG: hypothetical protein V4501_03500 [Pseudomonadota bacterium]
MLKHFIAIILLAVIIILTTPYVHSALEALVAGHNWIVDALKEVFSGGTAGNLLKQLIAALTIPILVALVPAGFYWLARRSWFPYFMLIVWVVWLIQTSALVMAYKAAAA